MLLWGHITWRPCIPVQALIVKYDDIMNCKSRSFPPHPWANYQQHQTVSLLNCVVFCMLGSGKLKYKHQSSFTERTVCQLSVRYVFYQLHEKSPHEDSPAPNCHIHTTVNKQSWADQDLNAEGLVPIWYFSQFAEDIAAFCYCVTLFIPPSYSKDLSCI